MFKVPLDEHCLSWLNSILGLKTKVGSSQARHQCYKVVSIVIFLSHFVRFCTMEYVLISQSFLLVASLLAKKVPMETESYNSLGGTIKKPKEMHSIVRKGHKTKLI